MTVRETAFCFTCAEDALVGVLHRPAGASRLGVLIVVGGPQYRCGSHRQFTLLARGLAEAGVPAMRFDARGMGDSEGVFPGFEALDDDIAAAVDAFVEHHPGLEEVVLWGLCDAASAILFHAHADPRIGGIVLLNPWVRTEAGMARAYLKHYYLSRLFSGDFWRKVVGGSFDFGASARSLWDKVAKTVLARRDTGRAGNRDGAAMAAGGNGPESPVPFPDRMAEGLGKFRGRVLLIMSGNDLTAREFDDHAKASKAWRGLLRDPRVRRHDMKDADHTFSRRAWRDRVTRLTLDWLRSE